jgi:hypothetical protein
VDGCEVLSRVLCKFVARKREGKGKKVFVDAEVRDVEGNVLAVAEAMWVMLREERL